MLNGRVWESGVIRAVGLRLGLLPSELAGLFNIPASAILVLKLLPVKGVLGSALMGLAVTVGDEDVRYRGDEDEDGAGGISASSSPANMCAPARRRKLSLNEALLKSNAPRLEPMLSLPSLTFGDDLRKDLFLELDLVDDAEASGGLGVQALPDESWCIALTRLGPGVTL